MPAIFVLGEGKPKDEERKPSSRPMRTFGNMGKLSSESPSEESSDESGTDSRKKEAGRLLLQAIQDDNVDRFVEAFARLSSLCSGESGEEEI